MKKFLNKEDKNMGVGVLIDAWQRIFGRKKG